MSTIVYQEIQSCFELRLIEPLVFKHKFAPPKPNPSPPHTEEENKSKNKNDQSFGGLSLLQSLTTPHTNPEKVYVHPLLKLSSTTLSKQSLDMCTESLGSETGNFTQISHEFASLSSMREKDRALRTSRSRGIAKKLNSRSYPPPLSSSFSVQVRPHRENGHLVIRATTKISPNNYFQTERKNGRLKLSMLKEKICTEGEEDEDVNGAHEWIEGVNSEKVGGQSENRLNRCKEEENGKSGVSSWGPFLVATS